MRTNSKQYTLHLSRKLKTSKLRISVVACDSLPESQCVGHFDLIHTIYYFNQSKNSCTGKLVH